MRGVHRNGRLVLTMLACCQGALWAQTAAPLNLSISYVPPSTGNQVPLQAGDIVPFPQTLVGSQSTVSIVIVNKAAAAATVQSVSTNGAGFAINTLPLLPSALTTGQQLQFSVAFSPTAMTAFRGSLNIVVSGTQYAFVLDGSGAASAYAYQVLNSAGTSTLQPNDTIQLPAAAVNTTGSTVSIRVTNTGNASGNLANVSVAGNAFQFVNPPIFPVTLAPNQSLTLTVGFSPVTIGTSVGRLRIEDAQFVLNGIGLGSQLSLTLAAGTVNVPVSTNGIGLLPNTTVGDTLSLTLQIANSGNQAGDLTLLSIAGPGFSLLQTPALPVHLAAGSSLQVKGTVAPATPGTLTAVLQLNDQAFTLRVAAIQPPVLPAVTLTKISDTLAPLQQPSVGVSLGTAYPYDLTGQLTLGFTPASFSDDPTIQFSSGGRTAGFRIPANTTSAIFSDGTSELGFQTGTTGGALSMTAKFAVAGYDLTLTNAPTRTATIPVGSPVIQSVTVANRTDTGFQLVIAGYSTSRTITRLDFQFVAAASSSVTSSTLSANVTDTFTQWYQSAGSLKFGTQFAAAVQINIAGSLKAVDSVSVSAANAQGSSAPQSVKLN